MYKVAQITRSPDGKMLNIAAWFGNTLDTFEQALALAETTVKTGTSNEVVVLHVAAVVKVKRDITVELQKS